MRQPGGGIASLEDGTEWEQLVHRWKLTEDAWYSRRKEAGTQRNRVAQGLERGGWEWIHQEEAKPSIDIQGFVHGRCEVRARANMGYTGLQALKRGTVEIPLQQSLAGSGKQANTSGHEQVRMSQFLYGCFEWCLAHSSSLIIYTLDRFPV